MNYWFVADEHYGHDNILVYCNRPFKHIDEMNDELINRHNSVVKNDDTVIHAGDFCMKNKRYAENIIRRLNGKHIFLRGSHDRWHKDLPYIWEKTIEGYHIVVSHYALKVWPRSHHNSMNLFGHSHGHLDTVGKQLDIGVDTHDYFPYSFEEIKKTMAKKPDNFNLVKKDKR